MLSLAEAQARLLAGVEALPSEDLPVAEAMGRRLAEDIAARLTQPPVAMSAMDGYAVRWADLPGPWTVCGESAAGLAWPGVVEPGGAVRIFTGAAVPSGADTVIVQEDVSRDGDRLRLTGDGPPGRGAHIRAAGLDFSAGSQIASAGARLTPALVALCAAAGHGRLPVRRRPVVAILATGDELVPPGTAPGPNQIVSSNGLLMAGLVKAVGGVALDLGIVGDDRELLAAAIRGAGGCDLLLTIGGASVGDRDLVVPALAAAGAEIDFWKIAIRPGKPMLSGRLGATRVIGLPGNPVSAFTCAVLFVLPLLRALQGAPSPLPATVTARTARPLAASGARQDHLRATLAEGPGGRVVTAAAMQDSSMLSVLASANALIVRPPNAPAVPAGDDVPVLALDSLAFDN